MSTGQKNYNNFKQIDYLVDGTGKERSATFELIGTLLVSLFVTSLQRKD